MSNPDTIHHNQKNQEIQFHKKMQYNSLLYNIIKNCLVILQYIYRWLKFHYIQITLPITSS